MSYQAATKDQLIQELEQLKKEIDLLKTVVGTDKTDLEFANIKLALAKSNILKRAADIVVANNQFKLLLKGSKILEEEAFRHLQESKAMLDNNPDIIGRFDKDCKYLYINHPISEAQNQSKSEVVGKTIRERGFPEHVTKTYEESLRYVFATGEEKAVETSMAINGELHYFESRWTPEFATDGTVATALCISRDITKRKLAEIKAEKYNNELIAAKNKAEEGEQFYNLLVNSIPNSAIYMFDKNLRYLIAGGCEISNNGFDKSQIIGRTLREAFPKEVSDLFEPLFLKALKGESSSLEMLYNDINYFQQVLPIKNHNDEFFAGIVISQNITEQKLAEKAVIESQRLSTIGEMSSSIAHDFNNSLQAIQGNIEIAKAKINQSENVIIYLNTIETIIFDVAKRVKALQRFGDIKQNNNGYTLVNFNQVVAETVVQLSPLWKDKIEKDGYSIKMDIQYSNEALINCNEGEIRTALLNVLKNSIEAMPQGGTITIAIDIKDKQLTLTITDTGTGMDNETKAKVFQPFYTTKGFEAGRGLGMSGVYSIVKSHKGNVFIESSKLGIGTTIKITLPCNDKDLLIEEEFKEEQIAIKPKTMNVLWVDDDEAIRENGGDLIEIIGHKCDTASSGKLALEYLDKNKYDILITDIGMPEMNGWQLIDAIENKFGDTITMIAVSGWAITEQEKEEHGIKYNLCKPFTIKELKKLFLEICAVK